jgi:bis(5'-nucleosyl)-tetraphosphatase (symmetrical)
MGQTSRSYVIGDVHACLPELKRLLRKIGYRPEHDRIVFAGDLVGRGPQPLETLEFVQGLGQHCVNVMGNHDLDLIAQGYPVDTSTLQRRHHTNNAPLEITRRWRVVIQWLARSPFLYEDKMHDVIITHAGVPPQLSLSEATEYARVLESRMCKNGPPFAQRLIAVPVTDLARVRSSDDFLRFIATGLTRIKFCADDGSFELSVKGAPETAPHGLSPWFRLRDASRDGGCTLIYGHWAALGVHREGHSLCIDDGCVFGGALAAVELAPGLPVTRVTSRFNVWSRTNTLAKTEMCHDAEQSNSA